MEQEKENRDLAVEGGNESNSESQDDEPSQHNKSAKNFSNNKSG